MLKTKTPATLIAFLHSLLRCHGLVKLCLNHLLHEKDVVQQVKICNKLAHLEVEHVCCFQDIQTVTCLDELLFMLVVVDFT